MRIFWKWKHLQLMRYDKIEVSVAVVVVKHSVQRVFAWIANVSCLLCGFGVMDIKHNEPAKLAFC